MRMKRKTAVSAGFLTACLICGSLHVSAYTADDVAQKAREAGWPETLIQTGYNQWASGDYTQEDLDGAYEDVMQFNDDTEEMLYNRFGIDPVKAKEKRLAQEEASRTAAENQETTAPADENAGTVTPEETAPDATETEPAPTEAETLSFDRIDSGEFINMSLDEKTDYINSLDEDQKAEFMTSLSREERNSIIKQLPTEEKVEIMKGYVDAAKDMGVNVTVDDISENNISVTLRNEEGIVIDNAAVGVVIDETGISHTKPLLFAGLGILTALSGFVLLYRYAVRPEKE